MTPGVQYTKEELSDLSKDLKLERSHEAKWRLARGK